MWPQATLRPAVVELLHAAVLHSSGGGAVGWILAHDFDPVVLRVQVPLDHMIGGCQPLAARVGALRLAVVRAAGGGGGGACGVVERLLRAGADAAELAPGRAANGAPATFGVSLLQEAVAAEPVNGSLRVTGACRAAPPGGSLHTTLRLLLAAGWDAPDQAGCG